ncbi:STAS/SEC14 domain-containing protein [Zunongwangia sp. F363]|uniref:STAS/SEC14 domain-containing protein n=1 Tax=Autumnicola tepida TaxID=3075595 RepID=A0ABU3CE98_9FLAO|nr:STAS/SEC14 domain-containing protein [Zunongwangia sp. F363]MDT0644674.1 STAS/SEC14 domain-containing protein [Zunongwangia sp. F363]
MIQLKSEQNIVYTTAEEKLTDEDYEKMIPFLQEKIREFGKIRWYFEMQDFDGWSLSAMWKDAKFDFENNENLQKVAMVGAEKWEKGLTQLMKPFADAEVKYFQLNEREAAKAWIASA